MSEKTIMEKLADGRQYRDISVANLEHRSETDENGVARKIVSGYATTFGEPYVLFEDAWDGYRFIYREQVDAGAFDETEMDDVIMQYDHMGRVFARRSNGTLELNADEHGLHIRADLGGTEIGRQLYEEIEGGYTTKMSFGFRVGEDTEERKETKDAESGVTTVDVLRTITKVSRLYDVSAVSLPANDATVISARSAGEGVIAELREEFARRKEQRTRIRIKLKTMEV